MLLLLPPQHGDHEYTSASGTETATSSTRRNRRPDVATAGSRLFPSPGTGICMGVPPGLALLVPIRMDGTVGDRDRGALDHYCVLQRRPENSDSPSLFRGDASLNGSPVREKLKRGCFLGTIGLAADHS